MRNNLFAIFAACLLFTCFGCPAPAHCDQQFNVNEAFSMNQGTSACLKTETEFTIRFNQVTEDSRCPEGVQCIWAGRVDVALTLAKDGAAQNVELSSGDLGKGGKGEVVFNGYTVRLENVAPAKVEGSKIEQKDYTIRLMVSK